MKEDLDFNIDIIGLVGLVLERLWLLMACMGAFMIGGLSYITITPRQYTSTALVEVPQEGKRVVKMEDVEDQDFRSLEVLKTIEQNLQRSSLYERVMQRDEIKSDPRVLKSTGKTYDEFTGGELAGLMDEWVTVSLQRGTRLIEISVEHHVPEVAMKLANALVAEYVREMVATRMGSSQTAFNFLIEEAKRVQKKLQRSENELQDYKKAVGIREKIEEQEDNISKLSQRYRDKHPSLIQARSLLKQLQDQFRTELANIALNLKDRKIIENERKDVSKLAGQERIDAEMKFLEARFNVLTREVETDRILYDSIVTRMKETSVTSSIDSNPVQIVEKAMLPVKPSKPKKMLILALSLFLGASTGLGMIVLLGILDNTVKTVDDAERYLEMPVLSAIPEDKRIPDVDWMKQKGRRVLEKLKKSPVLSAVDSVSERKGDGKRTGKIEPLVMLSDSGGHTAEAFRSLRASVKLLGRESECKVMLVTSAIPGEGKSFVSSNLALAFAQDGKRTLLVDGDLRRPMQDKIFNIPDVRKMDGTVGVLLDSLSLTDALYQPGIDNLSVLPVGKMAPNPAELLSGDYFEGLLNQAEGGFERIIIDSAPINAVSDSLMVIRYVQTVLLVVRAANTPKRAVVRAREQLRKAGRPAAGQVLNRLPSRSGLGVDPYYYYYSSGDGYGNVYGRT